MDEESISPRCVQSTVDACLWQCPQPFQPYISMNLNTLPKLLNHLLVMMGICDLFLFLSSWSISYLVFLASMFLNLQTACVAVVANNKGRMPFVPRFLSPNEFIVGVSLGITIGGTLLSMALFLVFGKTRKLCRGIEQMDGSSPQIAELHLGILDLCNYRSSAVRAVWFWSFVLFWLQFATCILLAAARHDIASLANHQYNSIGIDEIREIHQVHANRVNYQSQTHPPSGNSTGGLNGGAGNAGAMASNGVKNNQGSPGKFATPPDVSTGLMSK